jgi:hypothetical protein
MEEQRKQERNRQIRLRMALRPNDNEGYKLEDSFFTDFDEQGNPLPKESPLKNYS